MANSKNTIQNIPLEGELCMNSLKTEVKPFAGYNEKNTTFYGGTLSPIYDKTTELFDKNNSYTVFNSKGVPYTLVWENDAIMLYKDNELLNRYKGRFVTESKKILDNVVNSSNTLAVAKMINGHTIAVTNENSVYVDDVYVSLMNFFRVPLDAFIWKDPNTENGFFIGLVSIEGYVRIYYYDKIPSYDPADPKSIINYTSRSQEIRVDLSTITTPSPLITGPGTFCFVPTSGQQGEVTSYTTSFDSSTNKFSNWSTESNVFYTETTDRNTTERRVCGHISSPTSPYHACNEIQQLACRYTTGKIGESWQLRDERVDQTHVYGHVPVKEGTGFLPCPIGNLTSLDYASKTFKVYWNDWALISIGHLGQPIDECFNYGKNTFYYETKAVGDNNQTYNNKITSITYKKNDGSWWCYTAYPVSTISDGRLDYLKKQVIDGRYVTFKSEVDTERSACLIYDIEEEYKNLPTQTDWIMSIPPGWTSGDGELTGIVFGAAVNAGYTITNLPFVGYLPNPYIGYGFIKKPNHVVLPQAMHYDSDIQLFYSIGDTEQSAIYQGTDPQFFNTIYPIDPNGNVVLPISINTQLVKGYSNNDLVKEGNTVYPLMYWNNNQKIYAYMLLSGMENITNAFSLQGQQYTVDDDNIYAVSFNAGVIQSVTSAAYKKNLTFLGTLPTQAVFWSDFNKTFYAFTGDRILSRMFEASDINKIEYVGQNPATLSLWICTDDGIYVLSDKDMFKLDYNSKQVAFYSKNALIVTEGATNNECHAVSLYLNDNEQGEMIPVKLQTAYYGLGGEQKAVMDCWYLRLFDKDRTEGYVKVKVNTITDVTRHTEEKTFKVNPSDYDDNNIFYLRYQPKYQECVAMQLELETNLGIYSMSLGVNTTDSTAQVSKFNF